MGSVTRQHLYKFFIKRETSGKPTLRKKPTDSWTLDKSVKMVYYHQLSVIFVRVWRCVVYGTLGYWGHTSSYCVRGEAYLFAMCLQQQYDFLVISAVYVVDGMIVILCVSTLLFYSLEFGIHPFSAVKPDCSFVWFEIVHEILLYYLWRTKYWSGKINFY